MKQLSQKRADQKLAKELKRERKKANKAVEEKNIKETKLQNMFTSFKSTP